GGGFPTVEQVSIEAGAGAINRLDLVEEVECGRGKVADEDQRLPVAHAIDVAPLDFGPGVAQLDLRREERRIDPSPDLRNGRRDANADVIGHQKPPSTMARLPTITCVTPLVLVIRTPTSYVVPTHSALIWAAVKSHWIEVV